MSKLSIQLQAPNGREYTQPTGLFINNEFVTAKSNKNITSIDPACVSHNFQTIYRMLTRRRTEAEIATVQAAGPEDVDLAVRAAHKALKDASWKLLPATDRGLLMIRLADLLEQNKELLATIDAWDNGTWYVLFTTNMTPTFRRQDILRSSEYRSAGSHYHNSLLRRMGGQDLRTNDQYQSSEVCIHHSATHWRCSADHSLELSISELSLRV